MEKKKNKKKTKKKKKKKTKKKKQIQLTIYYATKNHTKEYDKHVTLMLAYSQLLC